MPVRETLEEILQAAKLSGEAAEEVQLWLARTEVFLDWVAQHPHLYEINCEAARLLSTYRGTEVSAVDVDYRGVAPRPRPEASKPA